MQLDELRAIARASGVKLEWFVTGVGSFRDLLYGITAPPLALERFFNRCRSLGYGPIRETGDNPGHPDYGKTWVKVPSIWVVARKPHPLGLLDDGNTQGSCRVGTVWATRAEITAALGEEPQPFDTGKSYYRWLIDTPRGVAEVGDYWWNKDNEHSIRARTRGAALWAAWWLRSKGLDAMRRRCGLRRSFARRETEGPLRRRVGQRRRMCRRPVHPRLTHGFGLDMGSDHCSRPHLE